jgi:hypothetical protein
MIKKKLNNLLPFLDLKRRSYASSKDKDGEDFVDVDFLEKKEKPTIINIQNIYYVNIVNINNILQTPLTSENFEFQHQQLAQQLGVLGTIRIDTIRRSVGPAIGGKELKKLRTPTGNLADYKFNDLTEYLKLLMEEHDDINGVDLAIDFFGPQADQFQKQYKNHYFTDNLRVKNMLIL